MLDKFRLPAFHRLFRIWRHTGEMPFKGGQERLASIECSSCGHTVDTPFCPYCGQPYRNNGSFFKGSFDNIPFLNEDAKRTFIHLLLRPGYMIKDYINGKNSRYLAPLTALIIFYAFFALASSIISPNIPGEKVEDAFLDEAVGAIHITTGDNKRDSIDLASPINKLKSVYALTCLDQHPSYIDTPAKASLAALEASLRSQGVFLFLWNLIILTLSIWMVFGIGKKRILSFSASATVSAYMLCQFCFFMLILLFATLGEKTKIGLALITVIMIVDFCQLFGFSKRKSFRKIIQTGLVSVLIVTLLVAIVLTILAIKYSVI